ncbi:hypothetical protein FZEAL_6368 [Fusarium zealandicum]|uniref:MICOS complex subunit MIC12 n=1 Tax=Fusarium zealandicum TaxID=1053134 RepID=A0A8H4UHW2_9HYPO|nr:hypothetical protein FZEAL_6368 [Fusarium zealandicum]
MGFTTGFTGGVTLTLSLAYLSVLAHQRTREQQGQALRSQALALQGLIAPFPPLPPPTRSEVAAAQRATSVEVAKDRWNTEVENAVRWVQHTDWVQVREDLEDSASRMWTRMFGTPSENLEQAERKVKPIVKEEAARLGETSGKVAAAAKSAYQKAVAESKEFAHAALYHSKDKENVDIAQEDGALPVLTPVERALQQRYEKPETKVNQTVEEVLKERYAPMEKKNNTDLRGLTTKIKISGKAALMGSKSKKSSKSKSSKSSKSKKDKGKEREESPPARGYQHTRDRGQIERHYGIGHFIRKYIFWEDDADERHERHKQRRKDYYRREDMRAAGQRPPKEAEKVYTAEQEKAREKRKKRHDSAFRPEGRHPAMTAVTWIAGNRGPPPRHHHHSSKKKHSKSGHKRKEEPAEEQGAVVEEEAPAAENGKTMNDGDTEPEAKTP